MLYKQFAAQKVNTKFQGFDFKIIDPLTLHVDASADLELDRRSLFSSKCLTSSTPPISSGEDESHSLPSAVTIG